MRNTTKDLALILILFLVFFMIRPQLNVSDTPPPTTIPPTIPPETIPPTTIPPQVTPIPTKPPEPRPVLEIVDEELLQGPGGEFWISGGIRNNGDIEMYNVQASLTLFDRFGNVMEAKKSAPIEVLNPGVTVKFNLMRSEFLKSNIADYNLTAEGREYR